MRYAFRTVLVHLGDSASAGRRPTRSSDCFKCSKSEVPGVLMGRQTNSDSIVGIVPGIGIDTSIEGPIRQIHSVLGGT